MLIDNEPVVQRRDGKCSRRRRASFERFAYGVSDEFLDRRFHGPRAKRLLNSSSNQEFKGRFGDSEIEAALFEALEFLRNGKAANFTLYLVGERFKNDLLVETSDQFRSKKSMKLGNDRSFECGERKPSGTQKPVRPDVACADDVEPREIVGPMVGERDARRVEHLQEKIPYQARGSNSCACDIAQGCLVYDDRVAAARSGQAHPRSRAGA